jgi:catechol 2,3-dioxygenase-like lactoylglutathione lyase family enzyme
MSRPPLVGRLDTIIIRARDWEAAADWYAEKLGLLASYTDPAQGFAVVPFYDHTLTIWQLKPGEELPPCGSAVPYPILVTSDAEALQTDLLAREVAVGPIEVVEGVRYFTFWDLDGNRLEACQLVRGS